MSVRLPWQSRPGMVRIKQKRLIELQRTALRVGALEDEIRETKRTTAQLDAKAYVAGMPALTGDERAAAAAVVIDPPLTADGDLHQAALAAFVDAAIWAHREQMLVGLGAGSDSTTGGQ